MRLGQLDSAVQLEKRVLSRDPLHREWHETVGRILQLGICTIRGVALPEALALALGLDDLGRRLTMPLVELLHHRVASDFRIRQRLAVAQVDDLQFRDLRRTATTQLAEAGCSLQEIAAIGGWSVDTVAKMMAVYGKTTITMAEQAIVKLETYRKRPLEG